MSKKNYKSLDVLKFIAAIAVVSIHTEPFHYSNNEMIVKIYEVIVRCAVPLFFMMTGFFLMGEGVYSLKMQKGIKIENIDKQIKKICKLYLMWTAIYFPVTIIHEWKQETHFVTFVFGFIKQLLFIGENYNSWPLWFLLAEIYALIVLKIFIKRMDSSVSVFLAAVFLWIFGNSFTDLCTYIDMLPEVIKIVVKILRFFFTSNGRLFTALLYIWIGGWLKELYCSKRVTQNLMLAGLGIVGGYKIYMV